MAEVIQFHCPSCGMTLRLPLAYAGTQGPCPGCHRDIVAPDPHRGIGARIVEIAPPPPAPEPIKPFAESPPLVPREEPVARSVEPAVRPAGDRLPQPRGERLEPRTERLLEAPRKPTYPPAADPSSSNRAAVLVTGLLCGLAGLALGYVLGSKNLQPAAALTQPQPKPPAEISKPPSLGTPAADPAPVVPNRVTQPAPEPIAPTVDPEPAAPVEPTPKAPEPPKATEAPKASAAAEAALKAFLDAPDWATRNAYVLSAEAVRPSMEAYSHTGPDGPTSFRALEVKHSQVDPKSGATVYVFYVMTDTFPDGIPVAMKETPSGWLADWPAFVEFRDNLFQKFLDGPVDATGKFHLIVSKPSAARVATTENENFSVVLLQSPLIGKPQLAFVKKDTETGDTMQAAVDAGGVFSPVLEITKKKTPEGKPYFEVMKIAANDWFPREGVIR